MKAPLSRAATRVVTMMLAGQNFYSQTWPRLRRAVREELERQGFRLQESHPRFEDRTFYPLHKKEFEAHARKRGIIKESV